MFQSCIPHSQGYRQSHSPSHFPSPPSPRPCPSPAQEAYLSSQGSGLGYVVYRQTVSQE